METDSLTVAAPKLVLIPFVHTLPWNRPAALVGKVEQPHPIRGCTVLMAEQNQITIVRIDMDVIDPELILAQYFFCLP